MFSLLGCYVRVCMLQHVKLHVNALQVSAIEQIIDGAGCFSLSIYLFRTANMLRIEACKSQSNRCFQQWLNLMHVLACEIFALPLEYSIELGLIKRVKVHRYCTM